MGKRPFVGRNAAVPHIIAALPFIDGFPKFLDAGDCGMVGIGSVDGGARKDITGGKVVFRDAFDDGGSIFLIESGAISGWHGLLGLTRKVRILTNGIEDVMGVDRGKEIVVLPVQYIITELFELTSGGSLI